MKSREFKIGRLVFVWDWFELTKWLNFANGVLFALGIVMIGMIERGVIKSNLTAWILVILAFALIYVNGAIVDLLRKDSLT